MWPAAVALLVISLATWHLTSSPAPWYDEGVNLQAARNLARSGRYELLYASDEPRPFDLQLTTGPTVIGPVAIAFRTLGVGLRNARMVMLVYTLLAALGLYWLTRKLYGPTAAALAVLVLCASGEAGPASTRAVVGEIAALAFMFWGAAFFAMARGGRCWRADVVAGTLFGLAVLTKGQFGLLAPALVGTWLVTRQHSAGLSGRRLAVVLGTLTIPIAVWQGVQFISLGPPGYIEHQQQQRAALAVSANAPFLSETLNSVQYLLSAPLVIVGLTGLVYLLVRATRLVAPAERLLLPFFVVLWLAWYLGFSVGYPRYAIPLIASSAIFAAVLGRDVLHVRRPLNVAFGLALGATLLVGVASQLVVVAEQSDSSAVQMGALITREVDQHASTESLEWELDVLTERAIHHPPPFVPAIPYTVPSSTTYLVDGPASKATELYVRELEENPYDHLAGVGPYDLYRRRVVAVDGT